MTYMPDNKSLLYGLKGQHILVTGASRGIGLGISSFLLEQGCRLSVSSRSYSNLLSSFSEDSHVSLIPCDLTDPSQTNELIIKAIDTNGPLDGIVCNVGSGQSVPFGLETNDEWHRMLDINLFSSVNVVQSFIKHHNDNHSCSIVCISSICGLQAVPGAPVTYSVSKAALNSYIKLSSRHLATRSIRINGVAPGNILFKGSTWDKKYLIDPQNVQNYLATEVPQARLGTPYDVANLSSFLLSNVSSFITGQIYTVDGGQIR